MSIIPFETQWSTIDWTGCTVPVDNNNKIGFGKITGTLYLYSFISTKEKTIYITFKKNYFIHFVGIRRLKDLKDRFSSKISMID